MFVLTSALLLAAASLSTASVAQQPAAQTTQQRFDAASNALDQGNWAEALRLFEALEGQVASNARTMAIVGVRKSTALFELGRADEAYSVLQSVMPQLPADDVSLNDDRFVGLQLMGRIAEHRLDYAAAQQSYRSAMSVAVPDGTRIGVYRGLIQTQLFDNPEGAVRDADAAIAAVEASARRDRERLGSLYTLKGRALLNLGRHADARATLQRALRLHGDLTTRVNYADIVNRNDLAMAALLAGDEADARRYLAFTGAGRFQRGFLYPMSIEVPDCENGVTPQDVVVVEFSVMDDGTVGHAMPVYASRPGPSALIFAQSVLQWRFVPEDFRGISQLFRMASRVELRCSNRPESSVAIEQQTRPFTWPERVGEAFEGLPASITTLRDIVAAAGTNGDPRRLLAAQLALASHPAITHDERLQRLHHALETAAPLDAPTEFLAWLALSIAKEMRSPPGLERNALPLDVARVLALPALRDQPNAAAEIKLAAARIHYREGEDARARALIADLRAAPEILAQEKFRTEIAEVESALAAAAGDMAAARAAYDPAAADAQHCRLVPRSRRARASSSDFPRDALRWGFEGWATQEPVIQSDGAVSQVRTIAAYPPFVFGEAGRAIEGRAQFEPMPPRGSCVGAMRTVRFMLPR